MKIYTLISFNHITKVAEILPLLGFGIAIGLIVAFAQAPQATPVGNPFLTALFTAWAYFQQYWLIFVLIIAVILLLSIFRFSSIVVSDNGTITLIARVFRKNKIFNISDIKRVLRRNSSIVTGLAKRRYLSLPSIGKIRFVTNGGNYTVYISDAELDKFINDFPAIHYDKTEFQEEKVLYLILFLIIAVLLIALVYYNSFYIS